ncbi:MAG TPA: Ppx/GppA family phosphatase, partial [Epsilonproteobacteria bacterium]|nr:Ppx/GppA family phosphatase [Campylobacterota bacterium]
RAFFTLQSFKETIEKYHATQILCVATSALRDAPNGQLFVDYIAKALDLHINIIDGQLEARYGAIAVTNLLPVTDGITVDIGGGSTDLALIRNREVVETISLNIGTVRLKELFIDRRVPASKARTFVRETLQTLPEHFKHPLCIGLGGTARTLSKAIMKESHYPFDKLHAYHYSLKEYQTFLENIAYSSTKGLKKFHIKKHRYDTVREGTLIFVELLKYLKTESVITSTAGVREGVYLDHLFPIRQSYKFPSGVNPSIASILSRFKPIVKAEKRHKQKLQDATQLYHMFLEQTGFTSDAYLQELHLALKLSNIGKTLTIYKANKHAFYMSIQELNYGLTHQQMILIALLLRTDSSNTFLKYLYEEYATLLPSEKTIKWLSFIFKLTVLLHKGTNDATLSFTFENKTLTITSDQSLYLAGESIKAMKKPDSFAIILNDQSYMPACEALGI